MMFRFPIAFNACLLMIAAGSALLLAAPPDEVAAAKDAVLLNLPTTGTDPAAIDYAKLPVIEGMHAVVSPADPVLKFQLHSYLAHHDGRYWCMWSQGPPVE